MNRQQLISVFLEIIKNTAYDPQLQPNGFAVFDFPPEFGSPTLGYTYQDYLDGNFWARQWYNNGANPDEFCAEYPILLLEQKSNILSDYVEDNLQCTFYLVLLDKIVCETCPPEIIRTDSTVLTNTLQMLRNILKEFLKVVCYQWVEDSETRELWVAPEYLEILQDAGQVPEDVDEVDMIENSIVVPDEGVRLFEWGEGLKIKYGVVGNAVEINFEKCDPTEPNMNYSADTFDKRGITHCSNC